MLPPRNDQRDVHRPFRSYFNAACDLFGNVYVFNNFIKLWRCFLPLIHFYCIVSERFGPRKDYWLCNSHSIVGSDLVTTFHVAAGYIVL